MSVMARQVTSQLDDWMGRVITRVGGDRAGYVPVVVPARLRRAAVGYVGLVTVLAAIGGIFVHGEKAFLVAWTYTGGAVALPALLVTWMVARRELGGMAGGAAWCFGLVSVYADGLLLLYFTAAPTTPLRDLAVVGVLPTIVLFGASAVGLFRSQGPRVSSSRLRTVACAAITLVLTATVLVLGDDIRSSDAAWFAWPAALIASVLTSGAAVCAWSTRQTSRPARQLNVIGLCVMLLGAVLAWAMLAQALSGFTLPSPPLLALQALTLGMALLIPIHAPRAVEDGSPSALEAMSRLWLAEDPSENAVLPRRLRRPAVLYVAITAPLAGLVGLVVHGQAAFLLAWVYVSALYTTPGMITTWAASRRTRYQTDAWRRWFLAVVALYLNGAGLLLIVLFPGDTIERLAIVAVVPCIVLFGGASIAMMRARSGDRSVSIDVIETAMVLLVVCAGAAILVGEEVWLAEERWFTIPAALVAVAVTSGLIWTVILRRRVAAANRTLESLGLALATVGTVDAWAMLGQGISGFSLPAAPLLLLQAVAMGLLLLLPLWVPRTAPDGLERLPLHAQVRHGWVAVAVTLAALPPIFVLALVRRDDQGWALPFLCVVVMVLLALAMLRQLLAFNESRHLYHLVAEGADERRRLLAEIMRSVDEDRHRFASQLHEQAISSYVAFASMTQSVRTADPERDTLVLAGVSSRLRDDLAEQAESLRQLMLAVRPLEAQGPRASRLRSPIEAYFDSLRGDASTPRLRVEADDELHLDWTTEAIALRIVQEAIGNAWRHAAADEITVSFAVVDNVLEVGIGDDGVGFDPGAVLVESGLATMRAFSALGSADLTVESQPGTGTLICVRFGSPTPALGPATPISSRNRPLPAPEPSEAHLRLVTED